MKTHIRKVPDRAAPNKDLLARRLGLQFSQEKAAPHLTMIVITEEGRLERLARPRDIHKVSTARSVICFSSGARKALKSNLAEVAEIVLTPNAFLYLLVPSMTPPPFHAREDEPVNCFACCANLFKSACLSIRRQGDLSIFAFVRSALDRLDSMVELKIIQLGNHIKSGATKPSAPIQWIIPHRGSLKRLSSCLSAVHFASSCTAKISVGFDEKVAGLHRELAKTFPGVEFWKCKPSHAGPYVVRNLLAARASAPILIFQDSDDIPCSNRAQALFRALENGRCDMIGSHVVVLDEIGKEIYPVRFPLDVTESLNQGANHALLHPTSAIRAEAFWRAGAFDCSMRHSLDTQFLLRSYFHFRSTNLNEFLYVKRIRRHSLTTSHSTGFNSFDRRRAWAQWDNDFSLIKSGALALNSSSLAPQIPRTSHCLADLDA